MSSLQLLLMTVVCSMAAAPQAAHGLPISAFFSYGRSAGDSVLPRANGASSPPVQLPEPFRLYGANYTTAYVSFESEFYLEGHDQSTCTRVFDDKPSRSLHNCG